jgi:4-hydroxy-tetrahydrodipicolinate synthase
MFEGVHTALITPFASGGAVDYDAFRALIDRQVAGGVDGIVPVGTTGESPTLEMDEHKRVIEVAVEAAAGRVKVIAGTGGNSTAEALELTQFALDAGADGSLQVTPYYNKPSNEGLFRHMSIIADLGLSVVLYNVPGRSARSLDVDLVARLAEHPNITTIKEAGGDVNRVSQYRQVCDIEVVSGDDGMTVPMMSVGAVGVISVASNIIPDDVSRMVHAAMENRWEDAREDHHRLFRLFEDLFIETNPIPVKTAAALMGYMEPEFRLPLCEMESASGEKLLETLNVYKLLP